MPKFLGSASPPAVSPATKTRLPTTLASSVSALVIRSFPTTTTAQAAQSSVEHIGKPNESSTGLGSGMDKIFAMFRGGRKEAQALAGGVSSKDA